MHYVPDSFVTDCLVTNYLMVDCLAPIRSRVRRCVVFLGGATPVGRVAFANV